MQEAGTNLLECVDCTAIVNVTAHSEEHGWRHFFNTPEGTVTHVVEGDECVVVEYGAAS